MDSIVFADTNLFLDAFLNRKPHDIDCIEILDLARSKKIKVYTSSVCLLTIMYFLQKSGITRDDLITIITQLLTFVSLISPTEQTFKTALSVNFTDLEDAVQYYTALEVKGVDYFITSNIKDYKKATIQLPAVTPKQFLAKYKY
jgi:predicted nucleic acid-binding protein